MKGIFVAITVMNWNVGIQPQPRRRQDRLE
jgi:hypothetical protein